jgi:hypothetical protein
MSRTDDGFLARWSRRKRQGEDPPTTESAATLDDTCKEAGEHTRSPEAMDSTQEAEPLPRIEELTAESDLSVFMRAGVPRELQKAALRRVWSLDPAIRDYCGPADYALNFNDPDSLPGFGSREMVELAKELLDELAEAEQVAETDAQPSSQPASDFHDAKD